MSVHPFVVDQSTTITANIEVVDGERHLLVILDGPDQAEEGDRVSLRFDQHGWVKFANLTEATLMLNSLVAIPELEPEDVDDSDDEADLEPDFVDEIDMPYSRLDFEADNGSWA